MQSSDTVAQTEQTDERTDRWRHMHRLNRQTNARTMDTHAQTEQTDKRTDRWIHTHRLIRQRNAQTNIVAQIDRRRYTD